MTAPNTGPNLMYSLFNGPKVDVICGDLALFPSEIRGETRVFGSTFLQRRMKVEKPAHFVLSLTDLHQMVSVTDCVAEIDSLSLVSIFPLLLPCRLQNTGVCLCSALFNHLSTISCTYSEYWLQVA